MAVSLSTVSSKVGYEFLRFELGPPTLSAVPQIAGSVLTALLPVAAIVISGVPFIRWWARAAATPVLPVIGPLIIGAILLALNLLGLWGVGCLWGLLGVVAIAGIVTIGRPRARAGNRSIRSALSIRPASLLGVGAGLGLLVLVSPFPLVRILLRFLAPDMNGDTWMYHMAGPELSLKLGHLPHEDLSGPFLYPNLIDNTEHRQV